MFKTRFVKKLPKKNLQKFSRKKLSKCIKQVLGASFIK